jgi:hypothetical protein
MVLVDTLGPISVNTKASMKVTQSTVLAFTHGQTAKLIKVTGKMVPKTDLAHIFTLMIKNRSKSSMDYGKKEQDKSFMT